MKTKNKLIITAMALVAIVTMTLALFACEEEDPHTHVYSTTWTKNATQHWHECSCGDKKDVANHTNNPCTICGACTCPPNTVHYDEPCDCGGGNCSDNCTVRYSVGNATFGTTSVPVYAGVDMTDEELSKIKGRIESAYLSMVKSEDRAIIEKTEKIVIVAGNTTSAVKTGYILNIGKNCGAVQIAIFFGNTVLTEFAQVRSTARETVRVANRGNATEYTPRVSHLL